MKELDNASLEISQVRLGKRSVKSKVGVRNKS